MRPVDALILCAALIGCSPAPRSAAYFERHPEEAKATLEACHTDAKRGEECKSAQAGLAEAENAALIEMFERGASK